MKSARLVALTAVAGAVAALYLTHSPRLSVSAQPRQPVVGRALQFDVSLPLARLGASVGRRPMVDRQVNPLRPPHRTGRPDFDGQPDPLRQSEPRLSDALALTPPPLLTFEGLSDDDNATVVGFRVVPPDTNGAAGPNHYVQWINLIYAVYNKTTGAIVPGGGPFAGNSIWASFGGPCEDNNDGDPIVLYDHLADRWLLSQFSINEGIQCVAVSTTGDPLGSYFRWAFVVSPGQNNDYPKFGLMPDAYYLSLRDFPSNDGDFASAVAFDRTAMVAGNPSPTFVKFGLPCLANDCPDGIQPPHLEGPPPAAGTAGVFTRFWDDEWEGGLKGSDGVRLWTFTPNFTTPAASTFVESFISGASFDSRMCGAYQVKCINQPGGGERLDPFDELQMYRAQFRHFAGHDSLVINTTVDSTGRNVAGIRWAELRNTGTGWTIHQESTYAPDDGEHRWMGSAAMDQDGNIALGYSVSSRRTFPSIRYTSRLAGDTLGTMPGGEVVLVAGSDVQARSFSRWGDYSAMSVDPVDGCMFWYTQEYQANDDARKDFDFKTRIGKFKLTGCS